jgi:hypothetical protein
MNLLREHNQFWFWTARIIRQFMRVRPGATALVIASTGIASVTKLLALFMPLKVILLAGSPGVPRYFPFIAPDQKIHWIIGLTIGAFIAYGLTLALEAVAARWSRDAGREILQGANQMSLHAMQEEQVKQAFGDFSGVIAAVLFATLGALLLAWINPALLVFLVTALLALFALTTWVLRGDAVPPPAIKAWVEKHTSPYLSLLSSLTFLGGFLVILAPFVLGEGGNTLLALLGIILTRQMLSSLKRMTKDAISLQATRNRIDAFVFRRVNLRDDEQKAAAATLHSVFAKNRRQLRSRDELNQAMPPKGELKVYWADSSLSGAKTLHLVEHDTHGHPTRRFQQQIFPPRQADQLDNETFLFQHVARERLKAPEVYGRFEEADFRCQICAYGDGAPVGAKEWPEIRNTLLDQVWSYVPTKNLVRSYRNSRPLLYERLTPALSKRLEIATDSPEEEELLSRWLEHLPVIQEKLKEQPLALHNPDLNRMNVVSTGNDHLIMAWGRWSLEPLGAAMFLAGLSGEGEARLEALRPLRPDVRNRDWAGDLQLAALCQQWERQMNSEQYKAALQTMTAVLAQTQMANNREAEMRTASM